MIKVEIKKEMMLEGKNKDLSKFLDDYIERFNSGKLSSKEGWIEPTYIGRYLEKSPLMMEFLKLIQFTKKEINIILKLILKKLRI